MVETENKLYAYSLILPLNWNDQHSFVLSAFSMSLVRSLLAAFARFFFVLETASSW